MQKDNIEQNLINVLNTKLSEEETQLQISKDMENAIVIPYEKFCTATELGRELNSVSPQKVNKLLDQKGLQDKDDNGNWIPTLLGKQFAYLIPYAVKKDSVYKIEFSLRWSLDVLNYLQIKSN